MPDAFFYTLLTFIYVRRTAEPSCQKLLPVAIVAAVGELVILFVLWILTILTVLCVLLILLVLSALFVCLVWILIGHKNTLHKKIAEIAR